MLGDGIVELYSLTDICLAIPSLPDILIFACLAGRKYYLIGVLSCIFWSSSKVEDEMKYFPSFLNGTLQNMELRVSQLFKPIAFFSYF